VKNIRKSHQGIANGVKYYDHSVGLLTIITIKCLANSVADPGCGIRNPGSGAFLTPGSGIGFFRFPDPKAIFLRA
jgi:hypothetical protein